MRSSITHRRRLLRMVFGIAVACDGQTPATGQPIAAPGAAIGAGVWTGITVSPRAASLSAAQLGRVQRIRVTEGSAVEAGEVLCELDDGVQRVRAEASRAKAESGLDVALAAAWMRHADREFERLVRLADDELASAKELSDAQTRMETSRLEHAVEVFRGEQAGRDAVMEQLLLERCILRAPFAGYVSEVFKHEGETVDEGQAVVRLVQLSPLEVWLNCPLEAATRIHEGDAVCVRPVDGQWNPAEGRVSLANRVADAASQTFRVKLCVPNTDRSWPVGLKVEVEFEESDSPHRRAEAGPEASTRWLPGPPSDGAVLTIP